MLEWKQERVPKDKLLQLVVELVRQENLNGGLSTLGWPMGMFVEDFLSNVN